MPLPSRPVNRQPEPEENQPQLADTPDVTPFFAEQNEEPQIAAPRLSDDIPVPSYDDIDLSDPTAPTAEEIAEAERLLADTPVTETSFHLPPPASVQPPVPEVPAFTAPEPAQEFAPQPPAPVSYTDPEPAFETPTPAAPVQPFTPEEEPAPSTRARKAETKLTEEQETQELIQNLPTEIKNSISKLFTHILDESSSEVILNGPNLVGFKQSGQRFFDPDINFGDADTYHEIINHFILPLTNTADRIGKTPYLIEGQLRVPDESDPSRPPLVARIHIIAPPAVEVAKITIAKKSRNQFTVDTLVQSGSLSTEMGEFLKAVARGRATIVFSGLSGSGKTTLLEALSREFDVNDRIVLVEDTAELTLPVSDVVELTSSQARPGESLNSVVTLDWLVRQANRMRPDRIIVGEVRGAEMAEFLTAANSGADGSMTTVHASSPQQTINKIVSLAMKAESSKSESSIMRDIASSVQIIVQMTLIDGKHIVSQIEEVSNTVLNNGTGIATNALYVFDRNTGQFRLEGRPTDELRSFLSQRGVNVGNPAATQFRQGL